MIPCISQATTLSTPFLADIEAYARGGWGAFEIWLTKLEDALDAAPIVELKDTMQQHGLAPVAAAAQGGLAGGAPSARAHHLDHFRRRLEWLRILDVRTLVIVPDFTAQPDAANLRRAVDELSQAATLAATFEVRLALEFQKSASFCASLDTAAALVAQAEHPNLGICLDLFHYYTGPSKFEDLAYLDKSNLFHVQICDLSGTPRELATDSDRILPGDGDFQLTPILERLRRIDYEGAVCVEVNAPPLWRIPPDRVAEVARHALARVLDPPAVAPPAGRGGP